MPSYDTNESFTITTTGFNYTGPSTLAAQTGLTITVVDGDVWEVTFTDAAGCSITINDTYDVDASCEGQTCQADAGTITLTDQIVCWGDEITYTVNDYVLGNETDGYVALLISPDAGLTSLVDVSAYGLYQNDTYTYTNDGSEYTEEVPLYVYSFIGEGSPTGSVNTNCMDMSEAENPFILLLEMVTQTGDYSCNGDGTAVLPIAVGGGMPNYDSVNEEFTVSVTGATYDGGNVGNGETIFITATVGQEWSVTFTDSEGCQVTETGTLDSNTCGTCQADAGTPTMNKNYVCWNEDVTISVSGETLDNGSQYVGLVIVENSGLTTLNGATVNSIHAANSFTALNDGSPYPINTPMYVYSYIGEGDPNTAQINPLCTDLNEASGEMIFLSEVAVFLQISLLSLIILISFKESLNSKTGLSIEI